MLRTKSDKKSLSTLIKEADGVFSEYVRRTRADDNGRIKCLICGAEVKWKEADAAHCFDRDNMATKYEILNVWPTDEGCNRFDDKHRDRYREALKMMIGEHAFSRLENQSRSLQKFFPWEIEGMIADWKSALKKLR